MPIINQTRNISLSSIVIPRDERQRSQISFESVTSLALAIGQHHWISDILVEQDTNELVAGERRCTAVELLRVSFDRAWDDEFLAVTPPATLTQLTSLASKCPPAWENWTKIPGKYGKDISPLEKLTFEFIENSERKELPWQDKAKAVYQIHLLGIESSPAGSRWSNTQTAQLVGLVPSAVSRYLTVWRAHESLDSTLQEIVQSSASCIAAAQAIERVTSRKEEPLLAMPHSGLVAATTTNKDIELHANRTPDLEPPPPSSLGQSLIQCADFHEFAHAYTGHPFNFLHCDFPYGIQFNESKSQHTAIDTKQRGTYDDAEENYWSLLETLRYAAPQLIAPSAHIMFWYSQNLEAETIAFFADCFPGISIQKFKMIWHKSDNSGILPDPQRYGRRTYETALLLTYGDRKIAQPKALSIAAPTDNTVHRSQKPLPVLSHFFSMFVDSSTRMLDPTCGSGSSVLAARRLDAASVLGLEKDPETAQAAIEYIDQNEQLQ